MGGQKRKALSQEEIWDDSALVEHWDEALKEYEQYHSIHARGENIEDVLRQAEINGAEYNEGSSSPYKQPKLSTSTHHEPDPQEDAPQEEMLEATSEKPTKTSAMPTDTTNPSAFLSGLVASSTGDEPLQNLMMSWYWAGYYTGFYQGQNSKQS